MIKIKILCVGKIKEKFFQEAIMEYSKRLSKYCQLEIVELKDEEERNNNEVIKEIEGKRILEKLDKNYYHILLDLEGKLLDSVEFSRKLDEISTHFNSKICFVIAGSNGFSSEVYTQANEKICFSKMTFTHQMIRIFLLEQIYRSFKILNHENYHK